MAQTYVYTIQATKDKQDSFLDVKTITPAFKVPVNEPLSASYWLAKSFQDASVLLVFFFLCLKAEESDVNLWLQQFNAMLLANDCRRAL